MRFAKRCARSAQTETLDYDVDYTTVTPWDDALRTVAMTYQRLGDLPCFSEQLVFAVAQKNPGGRPVSDSYSVMLTPDGRRVVDIGVDGTSLTAECYALFLKRLNDGDPPIVQNRKDKVAR